MVLTLIAALERPVSRVRLENYRGANGTDLDMVVNYFHNVELSEALYPALQAFEIALRNSIHLTLSTYLGTPYWFDLPGFYPPPNPPATVAWQERAIQAARDKLTKDSKPHDADRIVAEMHFGFWHGLFNRPFERKLWRTNQGALLRDVFPNTTRKQRDRQVIWDRIDRIRILRNRVMHYEPIWYRPRLQDDHATILEALSWISPEMHATIAMCDRFPIVMAGRASTEARVRHEITLRRSSA